MEMSEAWPDIFYEGDIHINSNLNPLTKFTSSSRSTKVKDILSRNISQMITKPIPIISPRTVKLCDETGHPLKNEGKSVETETTSKLTIGGKAIVEQILASEEINKSNRAGL